MTLKWGLSPHRQRLLDAARGLLLDHNHKSNAAGRAADTTLDQRRRILRCFPLQERQFRGDLPTPDDFHATLVRQILNARKRIYLASLYIGPAANPVTSRKEAQLLQALQATKAKDIKILLDHNRALRPVPIYEDEKQIKTISSAYACFRALQHNLASNDLDNPSGIFLLSVLPFWLQQLLPNPYNEVAGVFHLKCYIVDDDLILTGANLSEEYFTDRTDRYLWLTTTSSPDNDPASVDGESDYRTNLIECYAELVRALCQYAQPYRADTAHEVPSNDASRTSIDELVASLVKVLTVDADDETLECVNVDSNDTSDVESTQTNGGAVVAYAVPTLQVPPGLLRGHTNSIPNDTAVIECMLQTLAEQTRGSKSACELRLTSAYLNLTDDMVRSMLGYNVHLLTAGSLSHGFKVNPAKVGNKGKSWIPAVFDTVGRTGACELQKHLTEDNAAGTANLWYYQRPGWTFHSKGMWLSTKPSSLVQSKVLSSEDATNDLTFGDDSILCALTHGSGNYGYRSAFCDLESNLILVLPDTAPSVTSLPAKLQSDWTRAAVHSVPAESEPQQPLSLTLRLLLPFIRRFF